LPLLYHLPSSAFQDITQGSNGHYSAGPGYDLVTGRGSPVAPQVVAGLTRPFTVANGGSTLYQLDSTGNLWEYNSSGWQVIDTGVTSFAFGSGSVWGNSLVDLRSDGELRQSTGSGLNTVDSGVTSFAFGPAGTAWAGYLVDLYGNGVLDGDRGSGFVAWDSGVS